MLDELSWLVDLPNVGIEEIERIGPLLALLGCGHSTHSERRLWPRVVGTYVKF